jgi:hypothetical protein
VNNLAELRQLAIDEVRALKRENAPRVSDRYWTSPTGNNYGWWADKGFSIALGLLEATEPQKGEPGADYLSRVSALIRDERDKYRVDAADEDGACSGALDAAMWAISGVLPAEPSLEERPVPPADDPAGEWKLYYRDTFDRETPLRVEVSGQGLIKGLKELWARHLFETVTPEGRKGFSMFHLRWEHGDVRIAGEWEGIVRLRQWAFGTKKYLWRSYVKACDRTLLNALTSTHARLVLAGGSSEPILAAAAEATDRDDFVARLESVVKQV